MRCSSIDIGSLRTSEVPDLDKLISIGSQPLEIGAPGVSKEVERLAGDLLPQLKYLLGSKNGFVAFESALHVFSAGSAFGFYGLNEWNRPDLWVSEYGGVADGFLFFAEDIFGEQFGIREHAVYRFRPETAETEFLAGDLNGWAKAILDDCDYRTGYSVARDWQYKHGPLERGRRLAPVIPFTFKETSYESSNFYAAEPVELMRFRAQLFLQTRNLQDGAGVKLQIVD